MQHQKDSNSSTVLSVNFHLIKACNANCEFCYATFRNVRGQLKTDACKTLIDKLVDDGCKKLNFAGGEPTLRPDIGQLLQHAKESGLTTSIVTNGFRLNDLLNNFSKYLDWVGLSVDSGNEDVEIKLGRSKGNYVKQMIELSDQCRDVGVRVKLNTVVTALSWDEDMSDVVKRIQPERWKVFQVLPIEGQNDGTVEDLLITPNQFKSFVRKHVQGGLSPIVEDNDAMIGSYIMIDPLGRFFDNSTGRLTYSEPILDVGVENALSQIHFSYRKFEDRGGRYDWDK